MKKFTNTTEKEQPKFRKVFLGIVLGTLMTIGVSTISVTASAEGGDEADTCSMWENDVWDAADTFNYYNGYYPAWFFYWQSHGFSFQGYTGNDAPLLANFEEESCG